MNDIQKLSFFDYVNGKTLVALNSSYHTYKVVGYNHNNSGYPLQVVRKDGIPTNLRIANGFNTWRVL